MVDGDRELIGVMRKVVELFPKHGSERTHQVLTGPRRVQGLEGELQTDASNLEGGAHAGATKAAEMLEIAGGEWQWVHSSSGDGSDPYDQTHIWSYDFLTEWTEDDRQLRILAVTDDFTRECFGIKAVRSFTARDVIMT